MFTLSFSCFLPRRCPALFPRAPRAACRAMRAAAEMKGLQDDDGDKYPDLDEVTCRCVGSSSGSRVASATRGMELNGIVSHRPSVRSGVTRVRRQVGPQQRALAAAGHGRRLPLRPRRPGRRQQRHPRPQRGPEPTPSARPCPRIESMPVWLSTPRGCGRAGLHGADVGEDLRLLPGRGHHTPRRRHVLHVGHRCAPECRR